MLTGGDGSKNKCEMFDSGQWKALPDLNEGRYGHSSTAFMATVFMSSVEDMIIKLIQTQSKDGWLAIRSGRPFRLREIL